MNKKSIRSIAKRSLTITGRTLLAIFEKVGDANFAMTYPSLVSHLGTQGAFSYLERIHRDKPYVIHRLKKNGWITDRKIGGEVVHKLTEEGKISALQILIANKKKKLSGGKFVIVLFDIPEAARSARLMFKDSLKRMGFKMTQRSIWRTNRDVRDELDEYVRLLGIKKWVLVFIVRRV